jgi:hypothetical protein
VASLFSTAQIETWDKRKFVDRSQQLSQLLRGDFSTIAAELARVFPHTDGLQERFVPLVQRYAHELSGLYVKPVVRRFVQPAAATSDPFVKLQAIYRASKIDRALHLAHRELLIQNTVVLAVFPAGVGRVRVKVLAPWQVDWELGDPAFADDVQAAKSIRLRIPVEVIGNQVIYGNVVMTQASIYKEVGGLQVPVYGRSTANPFGRIPLIVIRGEDPLPGRPFAPVNEPLLTMQLALCVSESDTELLVHTQAWGQKVLENAGTAQQVEEVQVGPEKLMALVNMDPSGAGPKLSIVQGQPPLAQITTWNESRLRLLCSMFDLSPDAFLKVNTAVTASARAFDARDREESKARYQPVLLEAEQDLAQLIAAVSNLTEPVKIPEDVGVEVRYSTYDPPVDPLHESQALQAELDVGLASVVDRVADRDGITRQAARQKVEANLKERRELEALGAKIESKPAPGSGMVQP